MAAALQGILNGAPAALRSEGLGTGRAGGRGMSHPPVIQNFRGMSDTIGFFRCPQQNVVVLRTLITKPEPADSFQKTPAKYCEMSNVVHRQQKVRAPVRFKKWFYTNPV